MTLRSLAEGLRVVTVLLHPYIPDTAAKLLAALDGADERLDGARFGAHPGGRRVELVGQRFPKVR